MTKWTAADIPTQKGKLAVVTGANSGIGWHTALELARAGGRVVLTARTEAKGTEALRNLRREIPRADVSLELLDLADLQSVQAFAARVGQVEKLDLLVNNAGVMAVPQRELTKDGFERQLATNFLGPFALTLQLMPALLRSPSPRITNVSSGAANMGLRRINFDDLQWQRSYGPWKAYCQSKLADLLFMLELDRRSSQAGLNLLSNAAHPGFARTNLQTSGPGKPPNFLQRAFMSFASHDAAAGALPTLRAATSLDAAARGYFGPDKLFGLKGDPVAIPLPKPAQDAEAAQKLWAVAEKLTGARWSPQ